MILISKEIADYTIVAAQLFLLVALLPAIANKIDKPPFLTSMGSGAALFAMSYALLSLGAKSGAILTLLNALAWIYLAYQKQFR